MKFSPITFTFNGMLKTNEITGEGNSFSTEFRQYDPRLGRWMSLDKLHYIYPSHSPFNYALNNPIAGKDDNGLYTIFVNGYIYNKPNDKSDDLIPHKPYWTEKGSEFLDGAHNYFGDDSGDFFINGTGNNIMSTAHERRMRGKQIAALKAKQIKEEIKKLNSDNDPSNDVTEINFVTHSMGSALAEGIIEEFMKDNELKKLMKKGEIVHMSAADGHQIQISQNSKRLRRTQLNYLQDATLLLKNPYSFGTGGYKIEGVNRMIVVKPDKSLHPLYKKDDWNYHFDTKACGKSWQFLKNIDQKGIKNSEEPIFTKPSDLYEDTLPNEKNGEQSKNIV
jgi:RHS repeat-associated protein